MTHVPSPAAAAVTPWSDRAWEPLLKQIEQGRVIPIIGPDLVTVEWEGRTLTLERVLAIELARHLGIPVERVGTAPTLHEVVCAYLDDDSEDVDKSFPYGEVSAILAGLDLAIPAPLRQLAEITPLTLFVTTTFDGLLTRAINEVRYPGRRGVTEVTYWYREPKDLPKSLGELQQDKAPHVFHLLGRNNPNPFSYVLTEEDLLEFVCGLQSPSHRPERLFGELASNHVLIIGEDFPDWLKRLLLRMAKGQKLSAIESTREVLVDTRASAEPALRTFLHHFGGKTRIYDGSPVAFVAELHRRWKEKHPESPVQATVPFVPPPRTMPVDSIFLSYNRVDLQAMLRIKERLETAGLPVWFDYDQLKGGQVYEPKIREVVAGCLLFLPVMSKTTAAETRESFFRLEWNAAIERRKRYREDEVFIVPVVVDDLARGAAEAEFKGVHVERCEGGELGDTFIEHLKAEYAAALASRQARART